MHQIGCAVIKEKYSWKIYQERLLSLLDGNAAEAKYLIQHIRSYNNCFAMTSFVDNGIIIWIMENNLQNSRQELAYKYIRSGVILI